MEPLADEEVKVSGRAERTDQPMEYIICFAKVVKLYQQNTEAVSGVGVLTTSCRIAQKT